MSQIMKTFLGVFLIMFMVVTSSGVLSGFMTVVEAQNLHAQIINELKFTYAVAFFGIKQEHVLSGYAL